YTRHAAGAAPAGGGEMRMAWRSSGGIRLLPCASERSSDVRASLGSGAWPFPGGFAALVGHASACQASVARPVRAWPFPGGFAALVGHASACQASAARPVRASLGWTSRRLIPLFAAALLVAV